MVFNPKIKKISLRCQVYKYKIHTFAEIPLCSYDSTKSFDRGDTSVSEIKQAERGIRDEERNKRFEEGSLQRSRIESNSISKENQGWSAGHDCSPLPAGAGNSGSPTVWRFAVGSEFGIQWSIPHSEESADYDPD